mmetsp:Transcript_20985/g.34599  ORF Transcript_20985/g.34599 Transcript_20985/m.34599 type:complete len:101 (-) Transcript_20985:612-914(-)
MAFIGKCRVILPWCRVAGCVQRSWCAESTPATRHATLLHVLVEVFMTRGRKNLLANRVDNLATSPVNHATTLAPPFAIPTCLILIYHVQLLLPFTVTASA